MSRPALGLPRQRGSGPAPYQPAPRIRPWHPRVSFETVEQVLIGLFLSYIATGQDTGGKTLHLTIRRFPLVLTSPVPVDGLRPAVRRLGGAPAIRRRTPSAGFPAATVARSSRTVVRDAHCRVPSEP